MALTIPNVPDVPYELLAAAVKASTDGNIRELEANLSMLTQTLPQDSQLDIIIKEMRIDALKNYRKCPDFKAEQASTYAAQHGI